jgi:hypothetical protein
VGGVGGAVEDDAVAGLIGRRELAVRVLPDLRDHPHRDLGRPGPRPRSWSITSNARASKASTSAAPRPSR